MKKNNLKSSILFISIIIIIDITVGVVGNKYFKYISFGFYSNVNNSIKTEAEILILGSSRAMHHYNPEIIHKETGFSCYNGGTGGYGIFLDYAVLAEKIRQNKIPKMVILDISPHTLVISENSYSKLEKLLPYYKQYPSFKEVITLNPNFSKLSLMSNLYIYNSTLYDFIKSDFNQEFKGNGYIPINDELNEQTFSHFYLKENENFDENKRNYLIKIINVCKENNIKLIAAVSPNYKKFDLKNRIINELGEIFKEYESDFYDYSDFDEVYNKSNYFRDQLHMNSLGSNKFTNAIVNKLKPTNN
tara:strand:- start:552740 stop:553648 length:909 start_codon:yes stop_codon:yes gene_type:complete